MNTLLQKELWDEGRRVRTFVMRVVFISAVFALVWLGNFGLDGHPSCADPDLGLKVFVTLAMSLVATIMLLGPALTLPSVTAELESGTLDMLLCSQLSIRRIVITKVIARTVVVLSIVLACAPIMALATYYGGVAPLQAAVVFLLLCSMAFLFAAQGVRVALTTSDHKSPIGSMVGWVVRYNIVSAIVCLNPFIAITFAARLSVMWPMFAVVIHVGLAFLAIEKVVKRMGFHSHWGVEETWFPERRVAFARAIFSGRQEWERPLVCKELQEGRHATLYVVSCLTIALCVVIDVLSLGGSSWKAFAGGLRFSILIQVMLALFFSVLILSQMISSENEDETLDILNLTGLTPFGIVMGKIRSLVMPLKYMVVSTAIHAVVLGVVEVIHARGSWAMLTTFLGWVFGGIAIVLTVAAYCAAAIWFSSVARTRARAAQLAMGTLAAVLIVPYMIAPHSNIGDMFRELALPTMLARWPHQTGIPASWAVMTASAISCGALLRRAAGRLGRIPSE